jgi:hypothetical protein
LGRIWLLESVKILLPLLFAMLPMAASARTWTNADGRTLEADFVRMAGDGAVVLLVRGKEVIYPLTNLSEEDREFCREQADPMPSKEVAPAKTELARTADFSASLPEQVGPPTDVVVETIKEDSDSNENIYASRNFEFISDRRLTSRVVSGFAKLYEATYDAVKAMPWGAELNPENESGRFQVRLFSKEEDFIAAGGIVGSAGTAKGAVSLAQLRYLGVKDTGSRLILEDIEDNTLLIHELTHALRNRADRGLPTWAIEGFAEYMSSAPYQRIGRFSFKNRLADTVNYAGRKGGSRGSTFEMPMSLEEMLNAPRSEFYKMDSGGAMQGGAGINYAMSLLVMTYFWDVDQGKDNAREKGACIRDWLKAIQDRKPESEARELLLDGRTYQEIESAIVSAYRREMKIVFKK